MSMPKMTALTMQPKPVTPVIMSPMDRNGSMRPTQSGSKDRNTLDTTNDNNLYATFNFVGLQMSAEQPAKQENQYAKFPDSFADAPFVKTSQDRDRDRDADSNIQSKNNSTANSKESSPNSTMAKSDYIPSPNSTIAKSDYIQVPKALFDPNAHISDYSVIKTETHLLVCGIIELDQDGITEIRVSGQIDIMITNSTSLYYQLTNIGQPSSSKSTYISKEYENKTFSIEGSPNQKVSWQITAMF